MAITANKKFWTEFIDIYRTLPCLWNTKDENYNNRESRSAAWYKLVEKLQEVEPDANQDSVKRKINTFRSNFNRELRKIRQTQKSQPYEDYNPTLWYFDRLSFLYNQEKYTNNNNSSNLSTIDETYDGGDMTTMSLTTTKCELLEDSNQPETAPSISQEAITNPRYENSQMIDTNEMSGNKQKTLTEIERLIDYAPVGVIQNESKTLSNHANNSDAPAQANALENNSELQTTTSSRKLRSCFNKRSRAHVRVQHPYRDICNIRDEAALFGQTWACEFRKLNAQQKLFAKKAINEILLLGQLNALKLQTVPVNKTMMEMENSDS